jgi:hypothetical protein
MAMKTLRGALKRLSGEESVPLSPPHPPRTASPYRALTVGYKKGVIIPRLHATGVTVAVQSAVARAR